jgi:CPA2 family monovalent cation:H+ antiporter-2
VALGVAVGAAVLFGVSFALGAFVAGVVISESDLSYRAGTDALPMQDAFAVIFFVSAGMLIDPSIMLREPGKVAATVGVILLGNLLVSTLLLVWMRHPLSPSLYLGAGFGQIGEFSFILAAYGVSLGLLSADGRSLILASALCTIVANPLVFRAVDALNQWLSRHPRLLDRLERTQATRAMMTDLWMATPINHVILVGYGRVGRTVGQALLQANTPFIAIEQDRRVIDLMRQLGVNAVFGDATRASTLDHARPEMAQLMILTTPDPYHARQVIELARARNPELQIIVRTQGETNQALLEQLGVSMVLLAERELAYGMAYYALRAAGSSDDKADWVIASLRGGARMPTQEFKAMMTPPTGAAAQS